MAGRKLDNYLRYDLGYTSGQSDRRAPIYKLFHNATTGKWTYRLDESEENAVKLGRWWEQNKT